MKRKGIIMIVLLLIACLAFASCGNTTPPADEKTWPSASYLTDADKYTGMGKITHSKTWDDGSCSAYINEATEASVSAYRAQLENAGWTRAAGPVNNTGNTAWGYTKGEATCSIRLYGAVQTEERSSGNYSYNLYIGFENDGVILPPSGNNTLSAPVVAVSGSGLASWSAVANASGYKYKINGGVEQATQNTSVQLTNGQSIQVKAVGDETNYTDSAYSVAKTYTAGGGNPTGVSVSDFDYQLGSNYYISSRWDVAGYDNNDQEYVYKEYRKVALINGVYFIERYDFNYQKSNAQGNFSQAFYIASGSDYKLYKRYNAVDEFQLINSNTTNDEFNNTLTIALGETSITRAKQWCVAANLQYVTAGATSTHAATGRTVKKYSYGAANIPMYDFYVDTQTKACVKFDDYVSDGHINLSVFSTSGNAWGQNGLPARPDGAAPEPIALSAPVVSINNSGLASWAAIANAGSYKIKINGGTEVFAVGMSEQLSSGDTIQVKAIGDGENYSDSAWSVIQTYTAQGGEPQPTTLSAPVVTISETGLASWQSVTNASGYKFKISGGTEQTAPANRQVQLTDGQSISVKAVGNGSTYSDSVYSTSETYTEATITHTWPTSTKLTEYGFGGLAQPTGSTISFVGEAVASGEEPATLTIVISNGTGQMFDNLTTALYNLGATYNYDIDGASATQNKTALITSGTNASFFLSLKPTATTDVYDSVMIDYYATAGTDEDGNPIAAQTFIISFAKIDLTSSSPSVSAYEDYITLPNKFTITYGDSNEAKTLIKDGDKLYFHRISAYEDAERLAIKQNDGTYKIYDKDNKGGGQWDTTYVPEYDNIYEALCAMEDNFFAYAQRMINQDAPASTGSGTVAEMTCNVYNFADDFYTYSYYCYSGLVFKTEEHNNGQTVTFIITSYLASGDLSGYNV